MKAYLDLVKFSHTIFAMPFAMIGYFTALHVNNIPFDIKLLFLVILAMVFARNAAMAFNRWADKDIDASNPRTKNREIPAGVIHKSHALLFVALNCLLFVVVCWHINTLCFYLSPIALAIVLLYSFTKRFTFLCHVVLGLGLSLAPIGAYLAVAPHFNAIPIIYGLAVLFWVSGFDIIYALQDEEFDKNFSLRSIPEFLGKQKALYLSIVFHLLTAVLILFASYKFYQTDMGIGVLHAAGVVFFLGILYYQHTLVSANDISKVNKAFFTMNGMGSLMFGVLVILDFYLAI